MPDSYLEILLKRKGHLSERKESLSDELSRVEEQMRDIETAIRVHKELDIDYKPSVTVRAPELINNSSSQGQNNSDPLEHIDRTTAVWDKTLSTRQKGATLLRSLGRFTSIKDLGMLAHSFDKSLSAKEWQDKFSDGFDALNRSKESVGIVAKKLNGTPESSVRGFKTWLNEDGSIKEEHYPRQKGKK